MIPAEDVPSSIRSIKLVGNPWATCYDEVQWLVHKAKYCPGNILEIGTFEGATALELASAYPDRMVHCLDQTPEELEHSSYGLKADRICFKARHLSNVKLRLVGDAFKYTEEDNIGFVFIDGDHSWEGVRYDTEKALFWFRPSGNFHDRKGARQGIIAWHDATPDWPGDFNMQVYTYLDQLNFAGWPIIRVRKTCLAYINL